MLLTVSRIAEDYSLDDTDNLFGHLCNHAITKTHEGKKDGVAEQLGDDCNMWHFHQLQETLVKEGHDPAVMLCCALLGLAVHCSASLCMF